MNTRSVRVPCPECGPVVLPHTEVWMILAGRFQAVRWTCPTCHRIRVYEVGDAMFLRLAVHGCPCWAGRPAELDEAHDGPPLTYEDLLDFIVDLRRADPLRELR